MSYFKSPIQTLFYQNSECGYVENIISPHHTFFKLVLSYRSPLSDNFQIFYYWQYQNLFNTIHPFPPQQLYVIKNQ